MNAGHCTLIADGEGISVIDRKTGEIRPTTFKDWLEATRLIDALDEIGVYWGMAEGGEGDEFGARGDQLLAAYFWQFLQTCTGLIPESRTQPLAARSAAGHIW